MTQERSEITAAVLGSVREKARRAYESYGGFRFTAAPHSRGVENFLQVLDGIARKTKEVRTVTKYGRVLELVAGLPRSDELSHDLHQLVNLLGSDNASVRELGDLIESTICTPAFNHNANFLRVPFHGLRSSKKYAYRVIEHLRAQAAARNTTA